MAKATTKEEEITTRIVVAPLGFSSSPSETTGGYATLLILLSCSEQVTQPMFAHVWSSGQMISPER
jgi:hypothetical protein